MKVEEIMTPSPATCGPSDNLAQVVERMWDADCGMVPVVDDAGYSLGVITDRDICVASATRDLAPSRIFASEMVRGSVYACRPDDDVKTALKLMQQHHVRRLVVTSDQGVVHGVLSLIDVARATTQKGSPGLAEIVETLKLISTPV